MASVEREKRPSEREDALIPIAISVEEAERLSSIGRTKLYELLRRGRIKSRKIGRRRVVIVQSLRSFLEGEGD